jgi:hypothetical protein
VVNNVVTGPAAGGDVGVYVGAWTDSGCSWQAAADNNKVIRNQIDDYTCDVVDDGTATKVKTNVPMK